MKKIFLIFAVFVMAICANAQTNQYFWYQGNLMMGNPIAQIDSVTFGEGETVDTLHIMLPRTIIKTVFDTVYVTIHDTVCPNDVPEGALPGEFSVSPTKKVRFSKGNLQYNAALGTHQCADGTTKQGTWRFAEHQWDYVGNATEGTVYENDVKCNNALISSNYNGWIDLFGWGTSGWNSGAKAYQPWATSTNDKDYYPGNSKENDLRGSYINADWGVYNSIENGGNAPEMWYTLTYAENQYLLQERTNAENLVGKAIVNGVAGYVILPDEWSIPDGLQFQPSISDWSINHYTVEQWEQMEKNGAAFFPRGKRRIYGTTIDDEDGEYWTASRSINYIDLAAIMMRLDESGYTIASGGRHNGHMVRLVQDVE